MTEENLIRQCRYYHGEKECPFEPKEGDNRPSLWFYEQSWVHDMLQYGESAFRGDVDEFDAYGAGKGLSSDLPKTLLARLFNRFGKGFYSMADAAKAFPEFTGRWYGDTDLARDRVFGCVVGGAVGDALGYAVEFKTWPSIAARYGEHGITRYELDERGIAQISDDTQMSLFTAAGILLGMTRGNMRGIMARPDYYCRYTYVDWLHTQQWTSRKKDERVDSWLMNVPGLYSRRAPGNTCLSALREIEAHPGKPANNDSCGCGGVMRTAPVAIVCQYHSYAQEKFAMCDDIAAGAARITHRHPLGFMPSAVLNDILMQILSGKVSGTDGLEDAVKIASRRLSQVTSEEDDDKTYGELWPKHVTRMQEILDQALRLAHTDIPDHEAIESIGGGWTGHEALAIAVYSAVKHADSFEDAIISAVNHSGDSDSTGAVSGNIVGCLLGYDAIPDCYKERLELRNVIEEIAQDLYTGCIISEYDHYGSPEKRRWEDKYCEHEWPKS